MLPVFPFLKLELGIVFFMDTCMVPYGLSSLQNANQLSFFKGLLRALIILELPCRCLPKNTCFSMGYCNLCNSVGTSRVYCKHILQTRSAFTNRRGFVRIRCYLCGSSKLFTCCFVLTNVKNARVFDQPELG